MTNPTSTAAGSGTPKDLPTAVDVDVLPAPEAAQAGGQATAAPGRADPGAATRRAWTVELPAGMKLMNANHRIHWRRRVEYTKALRDAACVLAKAQRIPTLDRAHIVCVYEPPTARRCDPTNWAPSAKAAVDGLVDAGVLEDDDAKHLDGPDMRLGQKTPGGRLVLHIVEVTP
jgi:crossover junction endodeoxyribonuclease RusA